MPEISPEKLAAFRAQTYRTRPGARLRTLDQAVAFVNERGFVFFWPIKGVELPSLWIAAAGDRPVPNEHDDPGHVTWGWKDDALGKRRWYYGRLLRRRNMMVSLECLPYFYALSPNFGDPENDYLEQYRQGTITLEAKLLYEALLKKGAMDTLSLRREARLSSPGSEARFNRALDSLQGELKILPVGISQAGTWHYAFIYDLVTRHFPALQEQARPISEPEARRHLLYTYLQSVGAASIPKTGRLFGWGAAPLQKAVAGLVSQNLARTDCTLPGEKDPCLALQALV